MKKPRHSGLAQDAATFLALLGVLGVAALLLALTAMVLPQALGLVIVAGGFLFFIAFHYLVWGWWLSGRPTEPEEEDL